MTTVKEVITDALGDILRQAAEEPVSKSDGQITLRALNDMMTMWEAKGIDLGYTVVENFGDDVTVPAGAVFGIKAHLAIFVSPKFKAPVTAELMTRARMGWKAILNITVKNVRQRYPSILPMGSGNTFPSCRSSKFYTELDPGLLSDDGGLIALNAS